MTLAQLRVVHCNAQRPREAAEQVRNECASARVRSVGVPTPRKGASQVTAVHAFRISLTCSYLRPRPLSDVTTAAAAAAAAVKRYFLVEL